MVNPINNNSEQTVVRLLDAAEELFSRQGFNATSLRAITHKAGVNLAAVNYHFGSKDQLIVAVLTRGIKPINKMRLEMLNTLIASHSTGKTTTLPLRGVLDAFYRPAFEYFQDASRVHFLRLLGRTLFETGSFSEAVLEKEWLPLMHRFLEALKRALPELPEEKLHWRFHFAIGSMIFTISQYEVLESMTHDACGIRDNFEPVIEQLISFTAAGFLETSSQQGTGS